MIRTGTWAGGVAAAARPAFAFLRSGTAQAQAGGRGRSGTAYSASASASASATSGGLGLWLKQGLARSFNQGIQREVKGMAFRPHTLSSHSNAFTNIPTGPRPMLAQGGGTVFPTGEWPQDYLAQLRQGWLHNAVAQRAVKMVADGVAALPLDAQAGEGATGQGAAAPASLSAPTPSFALTLVQSSTNGQVLLEAVAMHLLLHGNAYVQIAPDEVGGVADLYALRPERVSIETDARGWTKNFLYSVNGQQQRLAAKDAQGRPLLLHIKALHPLDDHYGLGALGGAAGAIATHNAATRWNKQLLDNMARPSGALVYEPSEAGATLTAEQFERLRAEIDAHFSGAANAGRPLLLEGGLKWQTLSLSPTDMDYINLKAACARDIALAFGVPPVLLGLPGDATYSNYREANRALTRATILPMAHKILGALNAAMAAWGVAAGLRVDLDGVSALADDREKLWQQVSAASFLSDAEKREILGFGALAGDAASVAEIADAAAEG
jgi:HK97 family phage portal protein